MRTASGIVGGVLVGALLLVTTAAAGPASQSGTLARAVFAAGCFWCVESDFDKVPGVVSTTSGFSGGQEKNPTYEQVSAGRTGHAESVEVGYDPAKVSYEQLLDFYWHHVDPFTGDRQFCDVGNQYRPIVFYQTAEERRLAEESKARVEARFKRPVAVQIVALTTFYKAEEYHQDFYKKNPGRYHEYRTGCGRDRRLEQIWGKDSNK
jgi:peptide-methionine (S)-S-oxide reductase